MESTNSLTKCAESLLWYCRLNKIGLSTDCAQTLQSALDDPTTIDASSDLKAKLVAALDQAISIVPVSLLEIQSANDRTLRLRPLLRDAQSLLEFAAANAKKIDDDVRDPLVSVTDSISRGIPSADDEKKLLKAYEGLTMRLAPVTVETLEASKTVLPDYGKLFSKEGRKSHPLRKLTLGRFFNAICFAVILVATCVTLGFYSQGSSLLTRYRDLQITLTKLKGELPQKKALLSAKETILIREKSKVPPNELTVDAAQTSFNEAGIDLEALQQALKQASSEQDLVPDRLWLWAQQPCSPKSFFVFRGALCSTIDDHAPKPSGENSAAQMLEAGRTVASRLTDIYLPSLLGLLGAYAFILRKMTKEISESSLAKASALQHIVRLGLGALAGFASTWLLTPEAVGGVQLKNIPAWALAFVAGYGIELVFSFMDRIIGAFATKSS